MRHQMMQDLNLYAAYMESDMRALEVSSSSSPSSSLTASSPPSSSQTSIVIGKSEADAVDSSFLAPPFTSSPSSSPFSPSSLFHPSSSARNVRFAEDVSSLNPLKGKNAASYCVPKRINTKNGTSSLVASNFLTSSCSSFLSPPCIDNSSSSAHHGSPLSSAFISASASPFMSPPSYSSNGGSSPVSVDCPPGVEQLPVTNGDTVTFRPNLALTSMYTPSIHDSCTRPLASHSQHRTSQSKSLNASFPENSTPTTVSFPLGSDSLSSSARYRTCDVFIGSHGADPSLARFSKWLRAELELQGIACFSASCAQYLDPHHREVALRTIKACTFGVVIITKETFKNLYSVQEIHSFLCRKNLVPLFFDISPSDCFVRDIVERRGSMWEKDGGELWRLYDGDEREWIEAVDGLGRVEEWKLEAFNGRWRDCILKAVSLLGTRLGRRSVAERERLRKEKIDNEEFPFPRNLQFVGRDKELRALQNMLLDPEVTYVKLSRVSTESSRCEGNLRAMRERRHVTRRRSDADQWQKSHFHENFEGTSGRQRSDSDRWHGHIGRDENNCVFSRSNSTSSSMRFTFQDEHSESRNIDACHGRGRSFRHYQRTLRLRQANLSRDDVQVSLYKSAGITCVSGAAGIGKTELVLEYAYRYCQQYRMVLWVGGEARYIRQNYLKLSLFLGLDVGTESQVGAERGMVRTFDEQEMEAFQRVKRELQRDVPYLLVIDNLESERDWWDGRELLELIPRGGATHVILTTRLPKVMNLEPLHLSYLSGLEALSLMQGKRQFSLQEQDVLKEIEAKLERSTFGLAMIGNLLSKLPLTPIELLDKIEKAPMSEYHWKAREEAALEKNPYLAKLLSVCFSFIDQLGGKKSLAMRMAMAGAWFGPAPVSLSLLSFAASLYSEKSTGLKFFNVIRFPSYASGHPRRRDIEASSLLIKYGMAKRCSRQGWIYFHEIVQLYARKRGGVQAAKATVQSIRKRGLVSLHSDHLWTACFLVLGFGNDPIFVELRVVELLSFIRKCVFPLALRSFSSFSRCHAALELLRLSASLLEDVEKRFVSPTHDKSLCCKRNRYSGRMHVDDKSLQDVTLLKALILEARAKLLLKGGQFDAGEEICRTCISIRTAMLGHDHADTIGAQETLAKLVRSRSKG
ncbi:hypothetical protein KP509_08G066200 [Ceratopteris richardii]|uniref:TIR domain-containing protein n=1 Tax=Ceratopteris richardii TaxID=49495 RepID=A0A8T2UH77_CERRI|nr:hypothetical protein KP509_08G066200 [Ceratopteris richardii]KAH7431780.1 hypothetical protein KP509_08G066200 [Ceratopteris richardii]KAH7431782.1 hypothetical protein KP509_08G066200 [Ceratopteris richardii]KAH7431784.1 hypothetical protein KP509_08G066200 [Ceratopteris richardii]